MSSEKIPPEIRTFTFNTLAQIDAGTTAHPNDPNLTPLIARWTLRALHICPDLIADVAAIVVMIERFPGFRTTPHFWLRILGEAKEKDSTMLPLMRQELAAEERTRG